MKKKNNFLSKARFILIGLILISFVSSQAQTSVISPDGYAGYKGTTGGGNASPVTVSSASAFKSAVNNSNSAVIIVNGRFDLGGSVTIGSNKTIIGANSSSGLYGGTIKIQGSNYIIQNLTFGPTSDDVLEVSGATKVYITKCSFHDSSDELCSIVRAADYVTVSWCKFYFDSPDSHSFAHLIGNSDGSTGDRGKLHVTMHHNWYANGVKGRQPRVRFGHVHLYNNYYNSNNADYCIGVGYECHVRVENTHFDNIDDAWADYGGTSNGEIGWSGLKFEGCSQPTFMPNSFPVFSPPYSFSLDPVNNVESLVKAGAGNVIGSVGTTYNLTTSVIGQGSVSPNNGSYPDGASITLTATPESGWQFSGWSGALTGTANPATFTMDSNKSVTATFTETSTEMYSLTTSVNGQGSVSPSSGSYSPGSEVTLKATPSTGWYFVNWSGDASGTSASITITMDSDKSLTANFEADETGGGCDNPVTISIPFSKDGAGEFCWKTTGDISYVNSWNLKKLEINGADYTNIWSNNMPPKQDGYYNIYYVAEYSWAHFEIASAKSAKILEGVNGESSELDIHCYPNPVGNKLKIQFSREIKETVDVYLIDVNGKVVLSGKANGISHTMDMSDLPIGLYTVKVSVENQDVTERIVKQ